jgi:hypothetical protein
LYSKIKKTERERERNLDLSEEVNLVDGFCLDMSVSVYVGEVLCVLYTIFFLFILPNSYM